jgi:S1-C subfamily serine protease
MMMHALFIRHDPQRATATAVMARLGVRVLCVGSLLVLAACTGANHASLLDPGLRGAPRGAAAFPSNAHLRRTTVSLRMAGFAFGAGLTRNAHGQPTGNGVELVPSQWCGSGFVVGKDGTIVTNYHLVRRALRGQALFDGGATYDITHLKGYDATNDLAVLKIHATDTFATAQLGDVSGAEVRDSVLAAGNGLCEGLSVTEGTMSMFQRDERTNQITHLVHTAPIAPGNSGGPLYKDDRVIGINVKGARGYQRSYAVPVHTLQPLLQQEKARYLPDVFPPNPLTIARKTQRVVAGAGHVQAASLLGPGVWNTPAHLAGLTDYAIVVRNAAQQNLDLVIKGAQANLIGLGTTRSVENEIVFLSSDVTQTVTIAVVNPALVPVDFVLSIYEIQW